VIVRYDVAIIGGGIVGLATALKLLQVNPHLKLVLLEKEDGLARHQTGHNSGVIHSGIYYKPGSLKALNCQRGYQLLVDFCKLQGIPYELCGKIIVATDAGEIPLLNNLFIRGQQNGLTDLKKIGKEELKEYEPHVAGLEGIVVPQTGIVDYTAVAEKYGVLIGQSGGEIRLNEKVIEIQESGSYRVVVSQKEAYHAKLVINCCGLYSDRIARMTHTRVDYKIIPFRGEYFKLKKEKEHLVKNLIYPVPDPNFPFLGVHFTRMIGGGIEAGPNAVLAFKREGYKKTDIDLAELSESLAWPGFQKVAIRYWKTGLGEMYRSFSKAAFTQALQKLIPDIKKDDLEPGGSGVRAQACDRTGGLIDDFKIMEEKNIIHVCNAPSPAATSSLAIGETLAAMTLKKNLG